MLSIRNKQLKNHKSFNEINKFIQLKINYLPVEIQSQFIVFLV